MTDYDQLREEMVQYHLIGRGITDRRVLAAMSKVPRELFVLGAYRPQAYADCALPIECQQTISQPYIVALMTDALALAGDEKVLEVGTGSGYQAAILAELARDVCTVERHAQLSRSAEELLDKLGYDNIRFFVSDGGTGLPDESPFDAILVTAATPHLPHELLEELREGGRLVAPIGPPGMQRLTLIEKLDGQTKLTHLGDCRFVPLIRDDQGNSDTTPPRS